MRNVQASPMFPLLRPSRLVVGSLIGCLMLACPVPAEAQSPLTKIEALGLESMKVGRITTQCAQTTAPERRSLPSSRKPRRPFLNDSSECPSSFDWQFSDRGTGSRHTKVCRTASPGLRGQRD